MELRVAQKFRVERKIGIGCFGCIYASTDIHTAEKLAMKLEPVLSRQPQLLHEAKIYKVLHGENGPNYFFSCCYTSTGSVESTTGMQ
jgi:hypothetical protein